jgi:hypothetical protein
VNTGMEYEDILMRNQELMAIINRLTIERDELVTKTYKLEKERDDAREQEERFSDDALRLMHERNNALRERDAARREICNRTSYPDRTPETEAKMRGWDCYNGGEV